jgi:hypothetical protein
LDKFTAFFKGTNDGFNVADLAICLTGLWCMFCAYLVLSRAIKTGQMPYGFGGPYSSGKTFWLERKKHPIVFWFLFGAYSLMVPFGIFLILNAFFGLARKAD